MKNTCYTHDDNIALLKNTTSSRQQGNILNVFEYIERNPIIDVQKTATALNLTYNTVNSAVKHFIKHNIRVETQRIGRSKVYAYNDDYLNILR